MLDKNLLLAENQAVTTATTYTSDTLVLAEVGKLLRERRGSPMEVVVQVTETFAGGTSCDFRVTTGNTNALGSPQTQYSSAAVATAALTRGRKFRFPLEELIPDADATHFGLLAVSVGVHTTGKYTAWIQPAGTDQDSYDAQA
ncbi:MAG: Bbp16 family capsid cement protein [Rhodoglobus sp.]